jgi:hypothetical protein
MVVAGPMPHVMETAFDGEGRAAGVSPRLAGSFTGGPMTSTLALGLAAAAIRFIEEQARNRPGLLASHKILEREWRALVDDVMVLTKEPAASAVGSQALRQKPGAGGGPDFEPQRASVGRDGEPQRASVGPVGMQEPAASAVGSQAPSNKEKRAGVGPVDKNELRSRANSLVLRATQASLVAAKGAGYLSGHPAGRWCREALFFLVWSCPQPVQDANLCELAAGFGDVGGESD